MALARLAIRLLVLLMAGAVLPLAASQPIAAQVPETPAFAISEVKLGALYHDVPGLWSGFSLERPGPDANFEVLFAPWARTFGGYLRPALGATVNFVGDTSKAYADLRWEIEAPSGVFFALGMGAAVHNGELTAVDPDRKALGSRVLFHPSAELGYRFDGANSISLFADHMSNGFTQRDNDGMDTVGVRFGHRFAPMPADAAPEGPVADYSGAYLGATAGYRFETADWYTSPPRHASLNGFDVGALAGYGWQSGRGVFGLEIDASPAPRTLTVACDAAPTACRVEISGLYSFRPRFGWIFGNTLLYGTGGLALAPWQSRVFNSVTGQRFDSVSGVNYGVAVGGGIEQRIAPNVAFRAEVMHYGMAGWDLTLPLAGPTANQLQSIVGRAGVSFYFH